MLIAASLVVFLLGALHSGLGEWLIFRHLRGVHGFRALGFPPIVGSPDPPQTALRSAWHNLTIVGFAFAAILGNLGMQPALTNGERFVVRAISVSLLASAALWLAATRGKHIGWLGFLLAGGLAWLGTA